jgi:hypothetical protein
MKTFFILCAVSIVLLTAACGKSDIPLSASLIGTWKVVSDSTYNSGFGPYGTPSGSKYIGVPGDQYVFTSNTLAIREANIRSAHATYTLSKDTLKLIYTSLTDHGVAITGAKGSYVIVLSGNNLELNSWIATPGGMFKEFITLSR